MSTYEVTASRGDRYWLVHVSGVGHTQARSLAEAEVMAKDLIAVMSDEDIDPESVTIA